MKERSIFQRVLSFFLAVLMVVPSGIGNIGAVYATETVVEETAIPDDGEILIDLNWEDSEFKDGTAFNLQEYDDSTNPVKLKVSYSSQKIREEGYDAGELIITVKGIGKVNRAGAFEAVTGADKANSTAKTRDWSYTWNKSNDTYTFTNNNPIAGNSVFSGYFELVWNINARNSIHGYTQEDIKASLYIPDADVITSKVLSFSNETKCDEFTIDITRETLYSATGINGPIPLEVMANYVFIKYSLNPNTNYKSRGLVNKSETFMFDSDYIDIGEGGVITHANIPYTNIGDGKYNVTLQTNKTAGSQYVVVAYPREIYANQDLTAYVNWHGKFNECDDAGNIDSVFLAEDTIEFVVPPDFDFKDDGGLGHENKTSQYEQKAYEDKKYAEEVAKKGGHIPGVKMKNGTTEKFYLGFSLQFPIESDNLCAIDLVDDFIYITQNNGDYRQLTSNEYEMESVIITDTDTLFNENDVAIQSGVYPVTVYAKQNDEVLKMWDYPIRASENYPNMDEEQIITEVNETVWTNTLTPIREKPTADAEMIDYIEWGDNIIRIGTIDNYGWSIVQVDEETVGYIYSEYLETTETKVPDEVVWQGFWMDYDQTIDLPDGTTTFAVRYESLMEDIWYDWNYSYIEEPACAVNIKFHLDEEGWELDKQSNLVDGQVANTMFILMNGKSMDGKLEDYLDDDINIDLAQKDLDIYGQYQDRNKASVTFYGSEKSDYKSVTDIGDLTGSGTKFYTTLKIGAKFDFSEEESPNQFSLYTILENGLSLDGYKVPENIWDIMTLEGLGLKPETLANACTPEIIENYNDSGRTYIALHFDLRDVGISHEGEVNATFKLRVDEKVAKTSGKFPARSAVIIDKDINGYTNGKGLDDGKWSDVAALWSDIDRDDNTEELLARSYDHTAYTYADSSHFQITKFVETSYTDGWVQLPEVPYEEYGGMYRYKISVKNGNSTANNIVVMDVLETGANMQWQGTFQSVDLSECEALGLTGTVYYSSSDTPDADLNSGDWSTTQGEVIKAIAVDFGDSVLTEKQELAVIVNMKAPEDTSLKEYITENGAMVSLNMYDEVTGNETKQDSLATNFVQVKLTPPLRSIVITKVDEVDYTRLSGAKFELYNKETGEKVAETTSNIMGYAVFNDLPADGTTYIIKEVEAPYGYKLYSKDIEVVLEVSNKYLTIDNAREQGKVEVYKVNNLDMTIPVKGAEYSIFDIGNVEWLSEYEIGKEYENFLTDEQFAELEANNLVDIAETSSSGVATFKNLGWSQYMVTEKTAPNGYEKNDNLYFVEVNRENVHEVQIVNTVDIQSEVKIQLNKYVSKTDGTTTTEPLSGAIFELVRGSNNQGSRVGLYVTDENGQIIVSEVPYGNYFFREYRAPIGYDKAENAEFKLTPAKNEISLDVYNKRKAGSILITKKDNLGEMLSNIEFTLYDSSKSKEVAKVKTDDFGVAEIKNLEWGTYYLKETDAPNYYIKDDSYQEVVVGKNTLEWKIERVNETVKGGVKLTKTNEAGDIYLPNAEYTLYTADGAVVGTYITNENGELVVENLEWGSYYFKETKAPLGYGLSSETIRFSVNHMNAGVIQEIEVTDPLDSKTIVLTKKIKAKDINFDNGVPCFVFKVEGADAYGNPHTYYNIVAFSEEYVKNCTDIDGYVSQDAIFTEIVAGYYQATEEKSSRYQLVEIIDATNAVGDVSEGVTFDLVNYDEASATFVNEKYEAQDYSDAQTFTNVVKAQRKLTGIKATYDSNVVEAQSVFNYDVLKVVASYDDGSTRVLDKSEFILSLDEYEKQDGSKVQRFPNKNGTYTVTVEHTDSDTGIKKKGNFTVTIEGQVPVVVALNIDDTNKFYVAMNQKIRSEMFEVTATFNDSTTRVLNTDEYIITPEIAPDYEGDLEVIIGLNLDVIPNENRKISTTATVTVEGTTPVLMTGSNFNSKIPDDATRIVFTDIAAPDEATTIDVSEAQNGSILAWSEGTTFYVSSLKKGLMIAANANSSAMFSYKANLATIDVNILDTSNVTNMNNMFNDSEALTSIDGIEHWNTSNVTNMSAMFMYCKSLKSLDLSKWDTSKVTGSMGAMFWQCWSLTSLDVSNFDTSNITDMHGMFYSCAALEELDVSSFDTSKVTAMSTMFYNCQKLKELDLSGFDTIKVTTMDNMFGGCSDLKTIYVSNTWTTSSVTSSANMFSGCSKLVGGAGTKFSSSYKDKTYAKIDGINGVGYLTSCIKTNLKFIEARTTGNLNATKYDDSNDYTITGYEIISGGNYIALNTEIGEITGVESGIAVIKVSAMISDGKVITAPVIVQSIFGAYAVYSTDDNSLTFYNTKAEGHISPDLTQATKIYTGFDTAIYTSSSSVPWYSIGTSIKSVEFADKISPVSTAYWFYAMSNCTSMDFKKLDTSNVTNTSYMFGNCSALTELDLSDFNNSKVTNMSYMFNNCSNLTTIYASDLWSTASVTSSSRMFYNCTKLVGGAGTVYNSSYTDKTRAKIDEGTSNQGYFTSMFTLSYSVIEVGQKSKPQVVKYDGGTDFTIDSYEIVSGEEYVTLNTETGEITGVSNGTAVVKMTTTTSTGTVVTTFANVNVVSGIYAIYSADDGSLTFYNTKAEGHVAPDKTAMAVYTGFDTATYTSASQVPWYSIRTSIKSVEFADEISPVSTASWFNGMTNCTSMDLAKLDTSKATNMSYMFWGCSSLTELDLSSFNTSNVTNMSSMFSGCRGLTELDLSNFNTSNVTYMSYMFSGCSGLTELDVSNFDTSNVTNMSYMFNNCSGLTDLDVSSFDTSNVTDMSSMFYNCTGLTELDLSNFDTSNVTNMNSMFYYCSNLTTIYASDLWSTAKVTNRNSEQMFDSCYDLIGGAGTVYNSSYTNSNRAKIDGGAGNEGYLTKLVDFNYPIVERNNTVKPVIRRANGNTDITITRYELVSGSEHVLLNTRTGEITGKADGIAKVKVYGKIEGKEFVSGTNVYVIFGVYAAYSTDDDSLTFYNTEAEGHVTPTKTATAAYTGFDAETYTSPSSAPWYSIRTSIKSVEFVDEISPVSTAHWFYDMQNCTSMDLAKLDTSNVTSMNSMFESSGLTELDLSSFDTSNVTDMCQMFYYCDNLTELDVSSFNTGNVTTMNSMFYNCTGLAELDLGNFDTSNVTDMYQMFYQCNGLTELDLSSFNTSNVTNMSYMFNGCTGLTKLDLSSFNTSNVTNMSYMFNGCTGLTELDLSSFNTSKVTNMSNMFQLCSNLTTIYASNLWSTASITSTNSSYRMFYNCTKLIGGAGTKYNSNYIDKTYAKIDGGTSNRGYFTRMFALSYPVAEVGQIAAPKVTKHDGNTDFVITGYEIVSGNEYITLNEETGEVTGVASGTAVAQVFVTTTDGNVYTAVSNVYIISAGSYAVYSESDGSLTFYNTKAEGHVASDKTAMAVYTGFDTATYTSASQVPWYSIRTSIKSVEFVDEISPVSTAHWFYDMQNCTNMKIEKLNTSKVISMGSMFYNCQKLTELDVSNFDTSKVISMSYMFYNCYGLTKLNVNSFDTSNVTNMNSMFYSCSNLTTIYASDLWSIENVTDSNYMFFNCTNLVGGSGTTYNSSYTDKTRAKIDGGISDQGYLTLGLFVKYDNLDIGKTVTPEVTLADGYSVTGYEVISGGEHITLNKETGEVTALTAGAVTIKATAENTDGKVLIYKITFNTVTMAYAIYSETDSSLTFYKTNDVIEEGSVYNNKVVTTLYTDIEITQYVIDDKNSTYILPGWQEDGNYANVRSIVFEDEISPVSTVGWFSYMTNCTSMDLEKLNTSNVTDMNSMFCYSTNLTELDVSSFDTSKVTNMSWMFSECYSLTELDLNNFNTSNVTDMSYMFAGWEGDMYLESIKLSSFDTSNVTNMNSMFAYCINLTELDLGNFNTSKVRDMAYMFVANGNLETIYVSDTWTTTVVEYSEEMFTDCAKLVGGAETVYNSNYVDATYAKIDGGADNEGYLTFCFYIKYNKLDSIKTVAPEVKIVDGYSITGYEVISGGEHIVFNEETGEVTPITEGQVIIKATAKNADGEFITCESTFDIKFTVYAVYSEDDCSLTFCKPKDVIEVGSSYNDKTATAVYTGFDTTTYTSDSDVPWYVDGNYSNIKSVEFLDQVSPISTAYWFYGMYNCTSMDLTKLDTSNITDMSGMFSGCYSLTNLDLSSFDTSKVTDMKYMFYNCHGLTNLDLISFDTSKVTDMTYMFYNCYSLTNLDLSSFDICKVINMSYMFYNCKGLTELNLSSFDTSNVTNMSYMFEGCSKLTTIYASDLWSTTNVANSNRMFYNCINLVGGAGTVFNSSYVDKTYAKIDGGTNSQGYLTAILLYYDVAPVDGTVSPVLKTGEIGNYTIIGYEIVSGSEYITLNSTTGVVTSVAEGEAVVKLTAETETGSTIIAQAVVYSGSAPYAVYSADDNSLTFYKASDVIAVGNIYNDKTVTEVYRFNENHSYTSSDAIPWSGYKTSIESVVFEDEITPVSTAYWFHGMDNCTSMNLEKLDTSNATNISSMFQGCNKLTELDVSGFDTSNVTDMKYMFHNCQKLTELDVSSFDTSKVTNMSYMFYNCYGLTELDVGGFDTSNVTNMSNMFYNCYSLTQFDVNSFDTSKVTNMSYMFYNCHGLTALNTNSVFVSSSTNTNSMFRNCSGLTSLTLPSGLTSIGDYMLNSCSKLTSITIPSSVTTIGNYAFQSCTALTSITIPSSVTTIGNYAFQSCTKLASVTIGSAVKKIGYRAFYNCSKLTYAKFMTTSGWKRSASSTATTGTSVSVTSTSTAAGYLRSTYASYYWFR